MSRRRKHHSHHASDSLLKNIISSFFAFLLSIVFLAMTALLILRFGILSERGFLSNFNDDYVSSTMSVIRTESEYYTTPTGIELTVLDGVFTEEEIAADVQGLVRAAFAGGDYTPDMTEPTARMSENLRKFFEINHIKSESGSIDDVITEFTTDINKIYTSTVRLPGLDAIARVRRQYMQYDMMGLGALAVVALILIVICLKLHHYFHRGLRYVAYAAGGTALMSFVLPFALYTSKFYVGFNFQPEYFYHFMVALVVRLLKYMMMAGAAWMVITLILALIILVRRAILTRR